MNGCWNCEFCNAFKPQQEKREGQWCFFYPEPTRLDDKHLDYQCGQWK